MARKKQNEKAQAQIKHALRRASERYGLWLTIEAYNGLCREIQEGRAKYLGKQSNRLTVWALSVTKIDPVFEQTEVITVNVIYDKDRHTIVTFLPASATNAWGVDLGKEDDCALD